jgi:phenylpropionate dioxygenase-like ring-hydroxylating dioxygenase large terminal subunit
MQRESFGGPATVCPARQGYPRNCWYVAAFSSEVGRSLFRRRLLDEPVVMYRTEAGEPVALADRCPHRALPLSAGTLEGDAVRCMYHGMMFGADGRCREVPSLGAAPPPRGLAVRSYPVVERWKWIWIWMGDPAQANPSLIPSDETMGLDRPGFTASTRFMCEMKANYELLHENLLDTTHVTFLHPGGFDGGNAAAAAFNVEFFDQSVRLTREIEEDRSPFVNRFFGTTGVAYHRLLITETFPPNLNVITNVVTDKVDPTRVRMSVSPFPVTPGGPALCYQFAATSLNFPWDVAAENPAFWKLFCQDRDVLEKIQKVFEEEGPDLPEFSVRADQAAVWCRRKIFEMVRAEQPAAAP